MILLHILKPHINKNKIQKIKKILEENKKIYISEQNIPERPGNCLRQVKEDQNIKDQKI